MIHVGMDPNIFHIGTFVLSWHGALTFVAVAVAVGLVAKWGRQDGILPETVYSVALWAVIGGILGARVIHVVDRWDFYGHNLGQVFAIWQGGIAIYGAVLGGFLGGAIYIWGRQLLGQIYSGRYLSWIKRMVGKRIASGYLNGEMYARFKECSVGRLADLTAPALLIAQTIGRVGDIINGEHLATRTDLPWGFAYSHPASLSYQQYGLTASHPAVVYEMIWNIIVLSIIWKLRGRLAPPGMLFALYLMLYSLGRFLIQFLRLDKEWFAGLQEAHVIALIVLVVTVPLLAYKTKWVRATKGIPPPAEARPRRKKR
ncbi:prolipoprotein diacylglyceryl transferase [Dehalococcoidia bacterium]|nr:prolipoprotein diacylglyceryl transferase [Dehalococcoidia bacterium]